MDAAGREDGLEQRGGDHGQEETPPPAPNQELGRYLAAYRGNLTRSEAARRSGLPEVLWEQVESAPRPDPSGDLVPAAIVAAMCASVGADIATGLRLAGHPPELHPELVEGPIVFAPPTRGNNTTTGPCIATPHVLLAALAGDHEEVHVRVASVYRRLAQANWHIANRILDGHPRDDYWSGYAAAIRAVAEQQAWAADQEDIQ